MKWYASSSPDNIPNQPWLGEKVIERLAEIITADFEIVEHGSGGSTIWFAQRAKRVLSFEHNPLWYKAIVREVPGNAIVFLNSSRNVPPALLDYEQFDMLQIDGEPIEDRKDWINKCLEIVKPGGYVILDNANRPEY